MSDEPNRSALPLLGEKFPELIVETTQGEKKLPRDYAGKWFVLFSHPGDFTPVCTTEFVAFSKLAPEFEKINCELIGLSIDPLESHKKWSEWISEKMNIEVPFAVISDHTGEISRTLGMLHPAKGFDTVRAVFVVDDKGILRLMSYYPQELGRNVAEILRAVKGLQAATAHNVVIPENWPENQIIGNSVIVPPAQSEEEAKADMEKYECLDWWFCHRKL